MELDCKNIVDKIFPKLMEEQWKGVNMWVNTNVYCLNIKYKIQQ